MKTKEQYYTDEEERLEKESKERRLKWRNEILEEIKGWSIKELEEGIVKCRLSRISYSGGISIGWKHIHETCRFCGLEYVQGKHDDCCDNCWEDNKDKTLEELG